MFVVTMGLLLLGYPVAFTLGGCAVLFGALGVALDAFNFGLLGAFPNRVYVIMKADVLIAAPLFIFMGVMLQRSKVAEELLESIGQIFGRLRGGLGLSVTIVGALLAASTGVIGATVVTLGLLSLPAFLKYKYDVRLATGTICAAGTLGQIIPPSLVLVFLGDFLGAANQQAQFKMGKYGGGTVGVVELFAGALLPGLLLVALYLAYQVVLGLLRPETSPAIPRPADAPRGWAAVNRLLVAVAAPLLLILAVLGSILAGIATPTEAAAIGACGAIFLAALRLSGARGRAGLAYWVAGPAVVGMIVISQSLDLRLGRHDVSALDRAGFYAAAALSIAFLLAFAASLVRTLRAGVLREVVTTTGQITGMVFAILIGATLFTLVFRGFGGDDLVHEGLTALPGGVVGAMAMVMLVMFVLGFFLDVLEIMFVVIPVVAPTLLVMGLDPIWLGVMMAVNLQTSFLTPPFGFALFYLRGVAPPEIRTVDIYRGAIPFVIMQLSMLAILALFPGLATWLPYTLFGK
ncbi:MAG: TRAP transporter large permease subunit [Rhodospirillaceae bacterium]|nr:TRAP transporter large permease subunit [Rhodospirillaceae bacterium]